MTKTYICCGQSEQAVEQKWKVRVTTLPSLQLQRNCEEGREEEGRGCALFGRACSHKTTNDVTTALSNTYGGREPEPDLGTCSALGTHQDSKIHFRLTTGANVCLPPGTFPYLSIPKYCIL